MELSELSVQVHTRVHHLLLMAPPPAPWDFDEWFQRLADARPRPLCLSPFVHMPGNPSGAWQVLESGDEHGNTCVEDYIAYPTNTSDLHQQWIIMHECGHMVCQHSGCCLLGDVDASRRAPDLSPQTLSHLLTPAMTAQNELEAEMIAFFMLAAVRAPQHAFCRPSARTGVRRATRFAELLG